MEHPFNVELSNKYSDFLDVFTRVEANKLLLHSIYDLAIKTEKRKIPLFKPVYDQSKLKLDVIQKYI